MIDLLFFCYQKIKQVFAPFFNFNIHIAIQNLRIWQGELIDFFSEKSCHVYRQIDDVKTQVLNRNMYKFLTYLLDIPFGSNTKLEDSFYQKLR